MIVDDHAGFRQVVQAMLQTMGAEIAECADGLEAVARYAEFQPHMVLMDVAMKGLDGLRATAQIKARFPAARVLILTEYNDRRLQRAAMQAGACGYLLKEDLSQLQSVLQTHLESSP